MSGQPSSKAGVKPGASTAPSDPAAKPSGPPAVKPVTAPPTITPVASTSKPSSNGIPPKLAAAKVGGPPVVANATAAVVPANQTPGAAVPQALRPVPPKNGTSTPSVGVGAVD